MAGVPLLNGFLSKEMFFAEALEVEGPVRALDRALPFIATLCGHVQRRVLGALHPRRVLRPAAGRPAAHAARAAALDALSRSSSWCSRAWWSACCRRSPSDRSSMSACARCSARRRPTYSLAVWHGFTTPFLMSLVALGGGVALYAILFRVPRARRGAHAASARARRPGDLRSPAAGGLLALGALGRAPARHAAPAAAAALAGARRAGRGTLAGAGARAAIRPAALVAGRSGARRGCGDRRRLRARRGLAGEVPPLRRARCSPAAPDWWSA